MILVFDRPMVSEETHVPCRFDDETCVGQVTADQLCDVHRWRQEDSIDALRYAAGGHV